MEDWEESILRPYVADILDEDLEELGEGMDLTESEELLEALCFSDEAGQWFDLYQ